MPKYHVEKSIEITKPLVEVKEYLQDFRNWQVWSPWLITEPEATLTFKGLQKTQGSSYTWQGQRIGKGSMTLAEIDDRSLLIDLKFLKPFKSKATVSFTFDAVDEHTTKVTWGMDSKLPFFLGFMKKTMVGMIGMDYDRGLLMLKRQLETGEVLSQPKLIGTSSLAEIHYVALSAHASLTQVSMQDMESTWKSGINTFRDLLAEKITLSLPFGLYHKMNMATGQTQFDICFAVDKATYDKLTKKQLKKTFKKGIIKASDTYVVEHMGDYHHLGNAWSMAYSAARADKVSVKRKPMGMEIYYSSPSDTAIKDLKTEVVLFQK